MSRWLAAARAAMPSTTPAAPSAPQNPQNPQQPDAAGERESFGDFGDFGDAAEKTDRPHHDPGGDTERAAIIAESEGAYGPPDPPERHAAIVAALLAVPGRRHPPSWSDPAQRPQRGAVCACCLSRRWWGDANGWRCCTCYGPLPGTTPEILET
jgi:hypothetical protein